MVTQRFRGGVVFEDGTVQGPGFAEDEVATVADQNTEGGIPIVYRVKTAGGATANIDISIDNKVRVIDAVAVLAGAGTTSDTIQIINGTNNSNNITDAMDISGSDTDVVRAGQIDDSQHEVLAGGIIRVREVDGGGSDSPAADVYVYALRVA